MARSSLMVSKTILKRRVHSVGVGAIYAVLSKTTGMIPGTRSDDESTCAFGREDSRFENSEQRVTIKQLLSGSGFTVHASNAAYAEGAENQIREHLTSLKSLIQGNAQLRPKQTFEL